MENVNYKKKKKPKQRIRKYGKFNSVKESMNKIAFIRAFTLVSLKFSSLFIIRIYPFCLFYFIFHLTTFLPTLVLFYFYFFNLTTFLPTLGTKNFPNTCIKAFTLVSITTSIPKFWSYPTLGNSMILLLSSNLKK